MLDREAGKMAQEFCHHRLAAVSSIESNREFGFLYRGSVLELRLFESLSASHLKMNPPEKLPCIASLGDAVCVKAVSGSIGNRVAVFSPMMRRMLAVTKQGYKCS